MQAVHLLVYTGRMRSVLRSEQLVKNTVQTMRKKQKMTQEELAEAVGVTRQTIISIEKGKYTPSLPLALTLAKTFEVNVEDLFSI